MKEIHMSHYLKDTLDRRNRVIGITGLSVIAAACAGLYLNNIPAMGIIPAVAGLFITRDQMKKRSICKTGLAGEEALGIYLKNTLPDEYTAFYNVPVEHGDIDDCLLMGPGGLYAIEVKNHKGVITYSDNAWRQVKTGRGGTSYTGNIKNPSFQLIKNIRWLNRYFQRKDIKIWIQGIIVFTHPDAILSVDNLKTVKAVKLEDLGKTIINDNVLPPLLQQKTETHILQLMAA
ncbi:MAG: nuclease-related domain-containing protein [Proteobacteria bacterium]|nr:nuclease-related domain-containing protein [Pseudomonadota bacterium]